MSPLEYMFSAEKALDRIVPQPAKILRLDSIPWEGLLSVPIENSIAFEASVDLQRWSFYRLVSDRLEIVSPFGCCHLSCKDLDLANPIGLMSVGAAGNVSAWDAIVDSQWRDEEGGPASELSLKARSGADGSIEPLHCSMGFRGMGVRDFWEIVLLPSFPSRVYAKDGRAHIEAGGRLFSLPPGKASEHVLAGRAQWGLPDANGFFVLQKR